MKDLHRKAVIGILRTFVILVIAVFVPAGPLRYCQAWACLAAFFVPACAITEWVAKNDPALQGNCYSGALVMLYGIPLALGSWAGELVNVLMTVALIWRLLDEERFLVKNLNGYAEYRERGKYRLIPLMW
jgi:hypothetical protein